MDKQGHNGGVAILHWSSFPLGGACKRFQASLCALPDAILPAALQHTFYSGLGTYGLHMSLCVAGLQSWGLQSRWDALSRGPASASTSKSALIFHVQCLALMVPWWPMHHTCPSTWAPCQKLYAFRYAFDGQVSTSKAITKSWLG